MKKYNKQWFRFSLWILPSLVAVWFIILILKQVSLYDKLVSLYHALHPLFGGIIIAFLLQPVIDRLARYMKVKTAVVIVYIGILFAVGLLLLLLVPILLQQVIDFASLLPDWYVKIKGLLVQYHIWIDQFSEYENTVMKDGTLMLLTSLQSFLDTTVNYGIAYMTAFFISIDLEFWKRAARKIFQNAHWFTNFYKTMSNIVFQYLSGTMLDLLFVVVTSGVILYAADFPNALLYAVILALSNLFPYIGPTIGLVFVVIVAALSYESLPLITLVLIWVMQQIEANIVQPMIFHKTMDVRPILTFAALFVGEALFGIPGVILSPILASIMQIAFRSYLHAKTQDTIGQWEDIWYDFDDVMKDEAKAENT